MPRGSDDRERCCRRIREVVRSMYPRSLITECRFYDDSEKDSSQNKGSVWKYLASCGYHVVNCAEAKAETVDKHMIIDALLFSWRCLVSHTRPVIVLISGKNLSLSNSSLHLRIY
jgi:hypothetical protein